MKQVLLFLMAFSLTTIAFAQESTIVVGKEGKGLYFNLQGGYLIEGFNDDLDTPFRTEIGDDDLMIQEDGRVSLKALQGTVGNGATATFGIGYMFNKHVGIELQANYLKNASTLLARTETPTYQASHEVDGWRLGASPLLVISTGGKKVNLYTKTGLVIPLAGVTRSKVSIEDQDNALAPLFLPLFDVSALGIPVSTLENWLADGTLKTNASANIEAETYGAFSVGFSSTIGLNFQASKNLSIFVESNLIALTITADETTYTNSTVDFKVTEVNLPIPTLTPDALNGLLEASPLETPAYLAETKYVEELTETSNNRDTNPDFDPTKPAEDLSFKQNYNAIGFQLGLKFKF